VREAKTDLHLEAEDLSGLDFPVARTWPCRIQRTARLSSHVLQVFLRLPPAARFAFTAGQYIDLIGPNGMRRSYSLASAKPDDGLLELHIAAVRDGALSQYWFNQAKNDDLLRLHGPLGTFALRRVSGLNLIFLATGTGIAPIKAMLESMNTWPQEQRPASVTVVWGARHRQDLYLHSVALPGCTAFVPVLSRHDPEWTGATGHVQDVLMSEPPNWAQTAVYACGSECMVRDARTQTMLAGLPAHRFYSDAFVASGNN
jgi:CDP-4-dehydro-6-deoxyglucose reductase